MSAKVIGNYLVTTTQTRGFSLQNGGYYFALSDNYDLTILGIITLMEVMDCV
jgi:hypothetical protein